MRDGPLFFTTSILPVRESLVLRGGSGQTLPLQVRVGYFHHPTFGPTLIDTGYWAALGKKPNLYLRLYSWLLKPSVLSAEPLSDGLAPLGRCKQDIQTVILTHFHADHIGGLADLPQARILTSRQAWDAVQSRGATRNALAGVFPSLLPTDFQRRLVFFEDAAVVQAPLGLGPAWDIAGDGTVLIVDLPGHHDGHIGVCFAKLAQPLLYATDVQWLLQAVLEDRCPGFPASLTLHDRKAAAASVAKVRAFAQMGGQVVLCHDPHSSPFDVPAKGAA
jgi:glyoxylase-like metal-dependent hydrolase (beta-lactamase superfamily II)